MDGFKVGSLNINGGREDRKTAVVFEMTRMKHTDVLFIQETHTNNGNETDWSTLSGGVGFLLSVEVRHVVEGRCLLVRASFEHLNVVFYQQRGNTFLKR